VPEHMVGLGYFMRECCMLQLYECCQTFSNEVCGCSDPSRAVKLRIYIPNRGDIDYVHYFFFFFMELCHLNKEIY